MHIGNIPNFKGPSYNIFYGDGTTTTFSFQTVDVIRKAEFTFVFISGIQVTDYVLSNTSITFSIPPQAGVKVVVIFLYNKTYAINEISDGAVSADRLSDNNLKKYAGLDLYSVDKVVYSSDTTNLSTFSINALSKQILAATSHVDVGNAVDVMVKTGDQTITGTKTFTSRLGSATPIGPSITYLSKSGHAVQLMMMDGKLYSTCSNGGSHWNETTGRGIHGTIQYYGADGFKNVPIPSESPLVKVGLMGTGVAYALLADGSLYTWGQNNGGACGLGHASEVGFPTLSTTNVVEVYDSIDGNAGGYNSGLGSRLFIKKTDGYIYATGHNGNGQLGIGNNTQQNSWVQVTSLGTNVTKIFNNGAEGGSVYAQKSDYTIWAAGYNAQGQLGNGNTTDQWTFVDVTTNWQGGSGWEIIQCTGGYNYYTTSVSFTSTTIMLLKNGASTKVLTCGNNDWNSIGNGTATDISTPYLIPNSGSVSKISARGGAPCTMHMLNTDGTLYGWGYNNTGMVGNGTLVNVASPVLVESNVLDIFGGGFASWTYSYQGATFIKKADGLYAAGTNISGRLGVGHFIGGDYLGSWNRVQLPADEEVVDMGWSTSNGSATAWYAITASNRVYIWGSPDYNQLYSNNTTPCHAPVQIKLPRSRPL